MIRVEKGLLGRDEIEWDTQEELCAAIQQFRAGDYLNIPSDVVACMWSCQDDPTDAKWNRAHAGELLPDITQREVEDYFSRYRPEGEPVALSWAWLRRKVGPRPIARLDVYEALGITLWGTPCGEPFNPKKQYAHAAFHTIH